MPEDGQKVHTPRVLRVVSWSVGCDQTVAVTLYPACLDLLSNYFGCCAECKTDMSTRGDWHMCVFKTWWCPWMPRSRKDLVLVFNKQHLAFCFFDWAVFKTMFWCVVAAASIVLHRNSDIVLGMSTKVHFFCNYHFNHIMVLAYGQMQKNQQRHSDQQTNLYSRAPRPNPPKTAYWFTICAPFVSPWFHPNFTCREEMKMMLASDLCWPWLALNIDRKTRHLSPCFPTIGPQFANMTISST